MTGPLDNLEQEFNEWFEKNKDKNFIKCSSTLCPIAQFLNYILDDVEFVKVDSCHYQIKEEKLRLPLWARDFIDKFDNAPE